MSKRMAMAAFLAVFFLVPARYASAEDLAMQTVRRYSNAFNAGDCETMYELSSPAVLQPDPEKWHAMVCEAVPEWHQAGIREKLGRVRGRLRDGNHELVIVHQKRLDKSDGVLKITDGDYFIHSDDGGVSWKVLDIGCVNEEWVRKVFPSYNGNPPVHPL